MSSPPSVSVVTITFKDLEGLCRTVDSVRAQRYDGRIEHVIVDGGSGVDVVAFLANAEPPFAFWRSETDGGRYDAMNIGIAHSSGDLVWFMHSSDTFSDPDVIADVTRHLSQYGDVGEMWGYGKANRVTPDGRQLGVWGSMPFDVEMFIKGRQPIPHQASFFGTKVVQELGGYDLDFGIAADQLYIYRAGMLTRPVTINRVVCDFDTGGAGSERPLRENYADLRRIWDLGQHYPWGSRWRSRAVIRLWEYRNRSIVAIVRGVARVRSRIGGRRSA